MDHSQDAFQLLSGHMVWKRHGVRGVSVSLQVARGQTTAIEQASFNPKQPILEMASVH